MKAIDRLRAWARGVKREAVALWFAARDPRTPRAARLLCVFVVAYALSPIDLIPDFIPVLGFVDDALLLPGLMWLAVRMIPPELMDDFRREAQRFLEEGSARPRSMAGAILIVLVWVLVISLGWRWWQSV